MANKNAKGNKSASKQTSAKAKSAKAVDTVETVETVQATVEPTNAPVLDARADITEVPEGMRVCSMHGGEPLELSATNFSPIDGGAKGFRTICKPCQVVKATEWTTKRADLREAQATARKYTKAGIATQVPDAKTWVKGDPLMTIEHTVLADGSIELGNVKAKGAKYFPSVNATELFEAYKAEQKAKRDAILKEREETAKLEAEQRKIEREAKKAKREEDAKLAKEQADKVRAEKKAEREKANAEKAEKAKQEREAKQLEKAEAKKLADAKKAAEKQAERDAKQAAKAKEAAEKAAKIAAEKEQAKVDAINASNLKTVNALKGNKSATANA